jgi:hypothetical protein
MFPGHPYLEQEKRRAAVDAETLERQRVVGLIDRRTEPYAREANRLRAWQRRNPDGPAEGDEVDPEWVEGRLEKLDEIIDALTELRRAVQQGYQR